MIDNKAARRYFQLVRNLYPRNRAFEMILGINVGHNSRNKPGITRVISDSTIRSGVGTRSKSKGADKSDGA